MHFLSQKIEFPEVSEASADGLLAIGGDLSTERLLHAYAKGIFPWFKTVSPYFGGHQTQGLCYFLKI